MPTGVAQTRIDSTAPPKLCLSAAVSRRYLGAVFYLTQLSATIGYGNTACATKLGQVLTLVFLLIGIPLMGSRASRTFTWVQTN